MSCDLVRQAETIGEAEEVCSSVIDEYQSIERKENSSSIDNSMESLSIGGKTAEKIRFPAF